jgi:hypothetical protein
MVAAGPDGLNLMVDIPQRRLEKQPANLLAAIRLGRSRSHGRVLARSARPVQEPPTEAIEAFAKDVVDFLVKRRMRGAGDA